MKRFPIFLLLVPMLAAQLTIGASAASLQFAGPNGQTIAITAPAIEEQLGLREGSLYGVTVLSVPPISEGVLYSEGVEVAAYDYLSREALSSCIFLPHGEDAATRLALLPNAPGGGYTSVSLMVSDHPAVTMTSTINAEQYAWALADRRYYAAMASIDLRRG